MSYKLSHKNILFISLMGVTACSGSAAPKTGPTTTLKRTLEPTVTGPCPSRLRASIRTDKPAYPVGGTVQVKVVLVNTSATPCTIPSDHPQPFAQHIEIVNQQGTVVWHPRQCATGMAVPPKPRTLSPHETLGWVTADVRLMNVVDVCLEVAAQYSKLAPGTYAVRTIETTPNGQRVSSTFAVR